MSLQEWEHRLGAWATALSQAEQQGLPPAHGTDTPPANPSPEAQGSPQLAPMASQWLESIEQAAMACEFEVLLNQGQYARGMEIARDALRVVHALEDELSVYRPASDFSNINRFAHQRPIAVRYDVCQLLMVAKEVSRITARAFDISAGILSETWGFSRRQGRKPLDAEIADVLQYVDSEAIEVDQASQTVRLNRPGIKLNPGGIGKGYALDRVATQLVADGLHDFLIHGGRSSVLASGNRYDGRETPQGWWIALAHPLRWEEKLGRVRLLNQALGTSGAGKQFFHYEGVRYSHVIDPRTGWPAQGVLSATAICRSGTLADALATAFMVMGVEATRAFCEQHPMFSAILVSTIPGGSRLVIDRINIADEDWREGEYVQQ